MKVIKKINCYDVVDLYKEVRGESVNRGGLRYLYMFDIQISQKYHVFDSESINREIKNIRNLSYSNLIGLYNALLNFKHYPYE